MNEGQARKGDLRTCLPPGMSSVGRLKPYLIPMCPKGRGGTPKYPRVGWRDTPCKLALGTKARRGAAKGRKESSRPHKGPFLWLWVPGVKRSLRMSCLYVLQKISITSSPPRRHQRSLQDSVESGDCFQDRNQKYTIASKG